MGDKFTLNWQYALVARRANSILGCIRKSMARKLREVILPLRSALVEATSGVLSPVVDASVQEKVLLERIQQRQQR